METWFFEYIVVPWWFSLPGIVANILPGFARNLPGGTVPVSERILGPNKTWMAIPAALVGAGLVVWAQVFTESAPKLTQQHPFAVALCFGFGVPLGDWTKSFLKPWFGIERGGKWWVEKFDFLIASFLLLSRLGITLPIPYYTVPIVFMYLLHGPGNKLSYRLGWRNSPN